MNKETFKDKGLNTVFPVYVVFSDLGARTGEIRKYSCEIVQDKLFGIIPIKYRYRIRIFTDSILEHGHFYWELCNGVFNYKPLKDVSMLYLRGDGTDKRYTRGSNKMVFLSEYEAYEYAVVFNNNAKLDIEQVEISLNRIKKKYEK